MKNRVKIFHIRDKKRAMTVATEVCPEGKNLTMGIAFCNDTDNFSKKEGRNRAMGRMRSKNESLHCSFSGHSADDFAKYFNDPRNFITKPQKWKHGKLVNIEQAGLTFVEKTKTPSDTDKFERKVALLSL
jgi:hypothetical protein